MQNKKCLTTVDSTQRELAVHGTAAWPVACYYDDFSRMELPWHWHDELELAILMEGSATFAVGNEKVTMRTGEGIFVNAGVLHAAWGNTPQCRFRSIVFHPRLVGGSAEGAIHQNYILPLIQNGALEYVHFTPDIPWQAQALDLLEDAWTANEAQNTGFEFRVRACLSSLVGLLWENLSQLRRGHTGKPLRDVTRIKQMLGFIHEHCGENLTVRSIAAAASLSDSECLRCFRATIGIPPNRYLRDYRIQRAAQLLMETGLPVAAVAEQCGFSDVSYFTKTFRQLRGMAPAAYRKGLRAGSAGLDERPK